MCYRLVDHVQTTKSDTADFCERAFRGHDAAVCLSRVPAVLAIRALLRHRESPRGVCRALGLAPRNDGECDVCIAAVDFVASIMSQTQVLSEIIAMVDVLCQRFPAPFAEMCEAVVAQYVPQIIEWIEQHYSSQQICQKLGLCANLT
jgi:hypothetical protein